MAHLLEHTRAMGITAPDDNRNFDALQCRQGFATIKEDNIKSLVLQQPAYGFSHQLYCPLRIPELVQSPAQNRRMGQNLLPLGFGSARSVNDHYPLGKWL